MFDSLRGQQVKNIFFFGFFWAFLEGSSITLLGSSRTSRFRQTATAKMLVHCFSSFVLTCAMDRWRSYGSAEETKSELVCLFCSFLCVMLISNFFQSLCLLEAKNRYESNNINDGDYKQILRHPVTSRSALKTLQNFS